MTAAGVVLVIGSGGRLYREYLLAAAAGRDRLWLLDGAPPTWQQPYAWRTTVVELLDRARLIPDQELTVETARKIAAEVPVAGVFSYDETLVVTAAHVAEALGLRGLSVEGVENCRNKHRTRKALTAAGLIQPGFAYVSTLTDARAAADRLGFPVVVKPRGAGASIGVVRADGPAELEVAFAVAEAATHGGAPAYEGGVLVEQYLVGPEISVDGVSRDGNYQPFLLARKRTGFPPYFEETGHTVSAGDPLLADPGILSALTQAHRAIGVRDGVTHTEIRLTASGPAIIEVNARLGGDLIPHLGLLATGIDAAAVAVDAAVGRVPDMTVTGGRTAGIRFCYPPTDGTVRAVHLPPATAGLLESRVMAEPGTALVLPPRGFLGRYAGLIAVADSAAACDAALDAAEADTAVDLD